MPDKPKKTPADRGTILVASANLFDPNFSRSVVLLCDHRPEGSFGLVLNRQLPHSLSEVTEGLEGWDAPLFRGGPVQENTLHFIHSRPDLEIGSQKVAPGVFWGGDFKQLQESIRAGQVEPDDVRFFVGYSGWGEGQLQDEIAKSSWYLTRGHAELIFCDDSNNQWRQIVKIMGPDYAIFANFPDDARLN